MSKGKFGINLTAIAVIAFVFAALGNPTAVLLVAGFALLAERNEWLNRQAMQALLLNLSYALVNLVLGWLFSRIVWFFSEVEAYKAAKFFNDAKGYVDGALYVALIVLCVLAIIRVMKGKEAKLPLLEEMAGGNIAAALTAQSVPQYAPQPVPQVQEPAPQQAPAQPEPAAPQGKVCSQCGTQLTDDAAFCNECGSRQ